MARKQHKKRPFLLTPMAWDTQCGALKSRSLSDDEYWSLFNFVFSDACRKTTAYKFALVKAILDNLFNNIPSDDGEKILLRDLFAKFAESFWNLVVKWRLRQQALNAGGKTSKIEQIFNAAIQGKPLLATLEFASIDEKTRERLVQSVQAECKKYVLGALYGDFDGHLYAFHAKRGHIVLSHGAYGFMLRHKVEIEKLNYYAWAKFLEAVNDENALCKILTKLELSLPARNPLGVYRKILAAEFEGDNCFYCGRKLSGVVHTDHFIPWAFVKEDKLWNFVLACPECNLRKSDILPPERLLPLIQARNRRLQSRAAAGANGRDAFITAQFQNYDDGLLPALWKYARQSGFKTAPSARYTIDPAFGLGEAASPD